MKTPKKNLAVLACTLSLAVSATAFADTPAESAAPADAFFAAEGQSGWSSLAGTAAPGNAASTVMPLSTGAESGESQGWQPMESLRLELEYLYRSTGIDRVSQIAEREPVGEAHNLMANALIDFKFTDWVTPYLGVGVGYARVEPTTGPFQEIGRDVFAYQGIVGLSVPFSDSVSFFADGRFLRSDEFDIGLSDPGSHLRSWTATAGFRFTFGGN